MNLRFRGASGALLLLSAAASLVYFSPAPAGAAALWRVVAKGLAVSSLAAVAALEVSGRGRVRLAAALGFGSLGDVLLDLHPALFPAGLAAFLAGHLLYAWLWTAHWDRPLRPSRAQRLRVTVVLAASLGLAAVLVPRAGALAAPVTLYIAAITGMAAAGALAPFRSLKIFAGALLFVFSDAVLALDKFSGPVPGREWLVWPTYYAAQALLLLGYLGERRPRDNGEP
jgi:uncharacterized membrane protein YhhN